MAARAYWKGQIRLALVSIPVEIFSATKSGATIAFNQIHEPTGKRIKYEKVVPGVGPVEAEDIVKGFQYEKGSYVLLEEDELEAVKLESKKTLELTQFVDHDEIDVLYYEKPYYVVPADDLAEEAFIVLREALRRTKKVGLGQLALRGREYVVSIKPCGRGIVLETLRYADEVNKAQGYFRDIADAAPDEELLDLAETLIEKKTAAFDPSKFHDRYVDALHDLIERKRKLKGGKIHAEEEEAPARGSNVIDLMAALKKSIERPGGSEGGRKASTAKKPGAKKPPARKAPTKSAPARKRA
ncbi:non-homologous end joining protein Ku [Sphingosinicella rhizophila]|uniref:Non-homologous end joining protein Ku n=1 Tax=Sphingosinicella rhizophila TaxID=3050082 RepID=A0ABU3Q1Z7_9SPHN|nr:Ku protein [Sphingosinicella sp. GR2756]MDT9597450.1 Ku protein [Sphingosinicella sp. GR2756]